MRALAALTMAGLLTACLAGCGSKTSSGTPDDPASASPVRVCTRRLWQEQSKSIRAMEWADQALAIARIGTECNAHEPTLLEMVRGN